MCITLLGFIYVISYEYIGWFIVSAVNIVYCFAFYIIVIITTIKLLK